MSEPLLFRNSDDGIVYKITQVEEVNRDEIVARIAKYQSKIDRLQVELAKYDELEAPTPTATDTPAPVDQPNTPVLDTVPAEPVAPVDPTPTTDPVAPPIAA